MFKKSSFFGFLLHYYTQLQFHNFPLFLFNPFPFFHKVWSFSTFQQHPLIHFLNQNVSLSCSWSFLFWIFSPFIGMMIIIIILCVFGYHEIWIILCLVILKKKLNLIIAIIKLLLKFKSSMIWFKCSISSMCSRNLMFGFYEWILRMKLIFEFLERILLILFWINMKTKFSKFVYFSWLVDMNVQKLIWHWKIGLHE